MELLATGKVVKKAAITNRDTGEVKHRITLYQYDADELIKIGCTEDIFKAQAEGKDATITIRPGQFTTDNGNVINYYTAIAAKTPFDSAPSK